MALGMQVEVTDDPSRVLAAAHDHLVARPVDHNLVLTLLHARVGAPEPGRYWVVVDGADAVGVGFLSPLGFVVALTPMPDGAVDALVEAVAASGVAMGGVTGDAATAARFAGHWTEVHGTAATPRMGMRLYRLERLVAPTGVAGGLRPSNSADREEVLSMVDGFHRDTGDAGVVLPDVLEERIRGGAFALWEVDGEVVAMAARTEPIEGISRVYGVFTPPEHRRRGYAGAAVAALSDRIRADGADAILYTDLGNPTSNSVYRRIGYRAVAEIVRYDLVAPAS